MKLGTETGSVINHVITRGGTAVVPTVGMGATMCGWSDRYPATIVKITPTQIHVQEDHAVRTDTNGMSESQDYTYTPNPAARIMVFRRTKRGYRSAEGRGLVVGVREKYYDFSF